MSHLLRRRDLAQLLGISASTLDRMAVEDRRLHACRVPGRRCLYDRARLVSAGILPADAGPEAVTALEARIAVLEARIAALGRALTGSVA